MFAESYPEIKLLKVKVFVHLFQKVVGSGKARGFELRLAESEAEPQGFKARDFSRN